MRKVVLCPVADFDDGEPRRFEVQGMPAIAVYCLDGEFFATDDLCSHGEASLAEGWIEGGNIFCPFHSGAFDIRSGEATVGPCVKEIRTHKVAVEDGMVVLLQDE